MSYPQPRTQLRTHVVENQPPPLEFVNAYEQDTVLREAVEREGGAWANDNLMALGGKVFDPEWIEKANLANRIVPELRRFNRFGQRVDTVEFHPSWHDIMGLAFEHEVHALPWRANRSGSHVARGAAEILFSQLECGVLCPVDITYGIVPMIRKQPELAKVWEPLMISKEYDSRQIPHWEKKGISMAFTSTEKQGGSDIRRNSTFATPTGQPGPGNEYLLTGHKWFCSAAGADIIFVVAQTEKGPGCFLVPRWLPDGTRNPISLERLKDKLGNKSNASTELEFEGTHGWLIGEEGRGIPTVMEFMLHTRFGCALIPTGMMRLSLTQAIHHTRNRTAFQRRLVDQPLMRNVLADLAIESEAATTMMMRIARAFDASVSDERERAFGRISVAVAKYWVNKRIVPFVHECLETHGGPGYIEESVMPRVYRESPIHGIWEGPGNVISLDILRAFRKEPLSGEVFFEELELVRGQDARLDATIDECRALVYDDHMPELRARYLAERMAIAIQAATLIRTAPNYVADAFCMTRLGDEGGKAYGTLPMSVDFDAIIQRAYPG
ncbi:acyl-CoA dehydrogenase family protein [Mesorhizobium australicum]|uniref:Putative acyl-CoA dehydrogenase n=1 Tax=Mesorhizobium australicum TaxID=536018 RepID=A0A1X7NF54_9HYPH|nr:acyl-CoA dehydrogenase family protein [Mesorhizobium australicum]SMH36381.1 putative acyl-CoA dehydrogenase [Mesorhizobium australicum]